MADFQPSLQSPSVLSSVAGSINMGASTQLAMQVNPTSSLFQYLASIPRSSKKLVPDGVSLVCTDGTNPAKLIVTKQNTVYIAGGKLMGTIDDRMDCNLNCAKMVIAGAIIGAVVAAIAVAVIAAAGVFTGGGAWVAIGVGLAAGAGGAVAGAGFGQLTSMIPCICASLTNDPWSPTHSFGKAQGLQALIETSRLKCFLGGEVMIFYSPDAAQARADYNSNKMWFDLGLTIVGGAVLGATATGLGCFLYGGSVAFSAGGWGALGSYSAGGLSNMAGGYAGGEAITWSKDNLIYRQIEIGESTLYDYKEGGIVAGKIEEDKELGAYFPSESNGAGGFKDTQEGIGGAVGNDGGSAGGVYARNNGGLWGSDDFVRTATNPTLGGYGKHLWSQGRDGFTGSFKIAGKGNSVNGAFFGVDIFTDLYKAEKEYFMEDSLDEFKESLDKEKAAKAAIKVEEDKI